jgi:hypothetical protein
MNDERLGLQLCRPQEDLIREEDLASSNPRQLRWGRARIGTSGKTGYETMFNRLAITVSNGERVYGSGLSFFDQGLEAIHVGFAAPVECFGQAVIVSIKHTLSGIDFRNHIVLDEEQKDKQDCPIVTAWVDAWREYPNYGYLEVPFLLFDKPNPQHFSRYRAHFWPVETNQL